jgi:hypothetical protein
VNYRWATNIIRSTLGSSLCQQSADPSTEPVFERL